MKNKDDMKYTTTRSVFKGVKKLDHRQFDDFCTDVYKEGYRDGEKSVPAVDIESVMEKIATVKGIGTARIEKIRDAVEELFKAQSRKGGTEG